MDLLVTAVSYAVLIVWAGISVLLIVRLRVFSPAVLLRAPTRQSTLSVPMVGGVIVLYMFLLIVIGALAAQFGFLQKSDLGMAEPATFHVTSRSAAATTATRTAETAESRGSATSSAETESSKSQPASQPALDTSAAFNAVNAIAQLLTSAIAVAALLWCFKDRLRGWGLHPSQLGPGITRGLLGFFIVFPFLVGAIIGTDAIMSFFQHQMAEHPTFEALDRNPPLAQQLIFNLVAGLGAPIAEEIFFRGLVQTCLIQYAWGFLIPQFVPPQRVPLHYRPTVMQRWGAIVLASALFASLHLADQMPVIFLLSLALGYVYERTGILWSAIALHACFNGTELALYYASH